MTKPVLSALFEIETRRTRAPQPAPEPQVKDATARRVITRCRDARGGYAVLLVVDDCPFCREQHIHAGGTTAAPQHGIRTARCWGVNTTGLEYRLHITTKPEAVLRGAE